MTHVPAPVRLLGQILVVVGVVQGALMLVLPGLAAGLPAPRRMLLGIALLLLVAGPAVYWRCMAAARQPGAAAAPRVTRTLGVGWAIGLAAAAQLLGLALTALVVVWQQKNIAAAAQARFDRDVERIETEVRRHFALPLYALNGLRAMLVAQGDIDRAGFRDWVASRNLPVEFPGVHGLGLVQHVRRAELDRFVEAQRRDGAPDFEVRVDGGDEDLYIVRYIEPLAANRAALGIDAGRDRARQEAIGRALSTGMPTLSARITLPQDEQRGPGFLYILPLREADPRGAAAPPRPITDGLLYAPIVVREIMAGVADVADNVLDVELYEGGSTLSGELVYDSQGRAPAGGAPAAQASAAPAPAFESRRTFFVGGRPLALRITSTPAFEAAIDRSSAALVAAGGAAASCLMAVTVWLLAVGRLRAQRRAQRMTAELDRLARVARHTSNAVVITDDRLRVTWVNAGFTRITGYSAEEALGRTPDELRGGATDPAAIRGLLDAAAAGRRQRFEVLGRDREGREHWLDTEIQATRADDGTVTGFMEISSDITRLKQTQLRLEAAMRESEALLRTVGRHAVVSVTDAAGRITEANDAFCDISGYARDELLGQHHRIVGSGLQPAAFWAEMWRTISGGSPWRGEFCNRAKDGSPYWLDSMIAPFVGADGAIEKYVAIHTDVSVSKAVQQRLAETADRLTLAIEGGSDGLWDWLDVRADAEWWSPTFYAMLGLQPGEVAAGRGTFASLLHPGHLAPWREAVDDALAGRRPFDMEFLLGVASGGYRWFRSRAKVWRDAAGRPIRMAGSMQDVHDRRQAERDLARERQRLGHILDGTNVGTWEWNVETGEMHVNERWARIGGHAPAEPGAMTSDRWTADMHDDDRARAQDLLRRHFAGELEHYEIEARILRGDGQWVWVLDRGKLCARRDDGRPRWMAGTRMDITQRKIDEQALRDSEAFLDRAGRIAGVGGWIVDLLHGEVVWSDQTCRIHEVAPGHRPSVDEAYAYYPPEARAAMEDAVRQGLRDGTAWDLELPLVTARGRPVWVRVLGEVESEDGVPVRLVGALQDVTERRALDEELRRGHELMAGILENLPCGLSVYDRDLRLVAHNSQYRRLLDLPDTLFESGEVTFERILRFNAARGEYGPGDVEAIVASILEQMRHPVAEHSFERERPDGVTLEVRGAPMPAGGFVTTYSDVSTRKQAELLLKDALSRAEQASITKSQFLANMSHEIRTPMNAVLGMLALLHRTALTAQQVDYVSKTEGAARSLLGLLNDILDFSKVEAGKMALDPRPFRVERLLHDLSVILSANVGASDIDVLYDIDPALPPALLGDDMRLQQVLINLGSNAIKFTAQGEVVLGVQVIERSAGDVLLEFAVRDSGIGIAPEAQAHIFSGFSQAEASTTRRFGGTGLGLAICRHLVGLMGGELRVDSVPGSGSRFHFRIRLAIAADADAEAALPPPTGPLRVLVVDDNAAAREVFAGMARSLGWRPDTAASGAFAVALAERRAREGEPHDVLFVDWRMQGIDGWETGRRLLATLRALGLPKPLMMMVTGHGLETLAQRSASDQAMLDGFLVKPVTAAMLAQAVVQARLPAPHCDLSSRPATRRVAPLDGLRLLVVEDNPNNRQVAQELLAAEGAHVTLAANGELGVQAVAAADPPFDAVLMDVQMPVMDGYTATGHIRERLGLRELPIIAMTANAMPSDRAACLAAGMDDYVGKPFDLAELVAMLLRRLGRAPPAGDAPPAAASPGAPDDGLPAALRDEARAGGIDLPAALARMGGNRRVYLRALESFAADLPLLPSQLARLLERTATEEAARLMHTCKGLAATLGVGALAELAGETERRLRGGAMPSPADALVGRLDALVARTLEGIGRVARALRDADPAPPAPSSAAGADADLPALRRTLDELAGLLRGADMAALDAYERLREAHAAHLGDALQPLDAALAALDFDQALAHCQALQRRFAT